MYIIPVANSLSAGTGSITIFISNSNRASVTVCRHTHTTCHMHIYTCTCTLVCVHDTLTCSFLGFPTQACRTLTLEDVQKGSQCSQAQSRHGLPHFLDHSERSTHSQSYNLTVVNIHDCKCMCAYTKYITMCTKNKPTIHLVWNLMCIALLIHAHVHVHTCTVFTRIVAALE